MRRPIDVAPLPITDHQLAPAPHHPGCHDAVRYASPPPRVLVPRLLAVVRVRLRYHGRAEEHARTIAALVYHHAEVRRRFAGGANSCRSPARPPWPYPRWSVPG